MTAASTQASSLEIQDCSVLDTDSGTFVPHQTLTIVGGKVTRIARASGRSDLPGAGTSGPADSSHGTSAARHGASVTDDAVVIDGRDQFVVPGLIDMHVHTTLDPDIRAVSRQTPEERALLAASNLRTALEAGITSVRDLTAPLDEAFAIRRAWRDKLFTGARPFVCGSALTAVGGHGNEYGTPLSCEVSGAPEVVRAVRHVASREADCVKVIVNGPPARPQLGRDELDAAVQAAHDCGLHITAHAQIEVDAIRRAVLSGVDGIEHGMGITDDLIAVLAGRTSYLTPTLTVYASVGRNADFFGGADSPFVRAIADGLNAYRPTVKRAHEAGVRVMAGTDAGNPGVAFDSLHEELKILADECGFGAWQAIRCATVTAAAALGRPDLGHVRVGSTADLLIVGGNPLHDFTALSAPTFVVQRQHDDTSLILHSRALD